MSKRRIYLLDGTAIAYRAHFGMIRSPLYTKAGFPTSAIFGFLRSLLKIIREEKPHGLAVVFDAREKTFRHQLFPEYKATREKMPDELIDQLPVIEEALQTLEIPVLVYPGFEADDVIGTLSQKFANLNHNTFIVTGDKDFMQLVSDRIFIYKPPIASKGIEIVDPDYVIRKYGIPPERIIDWLALVGDKSDNVPGVRGIGEKRATELLKRWGSLENIYENLDKIKPPSIQQKLKEDRENAFLSKKLVTIKTNMQIDLPLEKLQLHPFSPAKVTPLFAQYELYSLIDEIKQFTRISVKDDYQYVCIDTKEKLEELIQQLEAQECFALDTETDCMDPISAHLVGLSFSWKKKQAYYIPLQFKDKQRSLFDSEDDTRFILSRLKPLLESDQIKKIGQNLKYDLQVLKNHGIELQGIHFDTMIAAFLLDPDARSYKLDLLSQQYLNYTMQSIEELIGKKGKNQLSMAEVEKDKQVFYAAEDADITYRLYLVLKDLLEKNDLNTVFYEIEIPLVPVLAWMERAGVYLDRALLQQQSLELEKEIKKIQQQIFELAGHEFNINSPKQLAAVLFDELNLKPVRKRSTDVNVLEKLKNLHPLPEQILHYRQLSKLKNTYLDTLPQLINPETGRVHSSFNQTVASTGRLSSSNPNFQNIPVRTDIGREIRKAFIPEDERDFILSADYSQIELRIMAHISKDENLRKAFQQGLDVHAQTASIVYGVPLEEVLPEMRRTAKVVNFGIMYGAGPFRMSDELGIPVNEAEQLIASYFHKFPGINRYIYETIAYAREHKYVKTLSGRRRYIPDIDSDNKRKKEAAERAAINMPIQGTAADMIKIAMIKIYQEMTTRKMRSKMILQIHDELLFEVDKEELEELKTLVKNNMEEALKLDIPVVVDLGTGKSWYEAH